MKLNTQKIRIELAIINKSQAWLAKQMGYTRQYINFLMKRKSVLRVNEMATILGIDPNDLIL